MASVYEALENLFQKARKAIAERDWDKAKQLYLQALGLKSDNPDVHYGLATVFFQLRELTSAAHHFKEATRLDPLRAGAFINLGAVQNLLEEYNDAVTTLRRGLQLDPNRVEGYYNLGVVYRNLGQDDLAIQAYREALRINPRMGDAHLNLANLLMARHSFRQALAHYEQALQVRPNWAKAIDGIAQAREALDSERKSGPLPAASAKRGADPGIQVDPDTHSSFLIHLHQSTVETEESGRLMHQILEREVEPTIKDLSTALLYPHGLRTELDECVAKFEAAVERVRSTHQQMQNRVGQIKKLEQQMPQK
jgi:tetratricopeptide (TPR) repeat protein